MVFWHRMGFRIFWRWNSRNNGGRPRVTRELRDLIRRMAREDPSWGAPRVMRELLKLGLETAERTVAQYVPKGAASQGGVKMWILFRHRTVSRSHLPCWSRKSSSGSAPRRAPDRPGVRKSRYYWTHWVVRGIASYPVKHVDVDTRRE